MGISKSQARVLTLVGAATALVVVGGGGAVAGSLVTGQDIKDHSIGASDLARNSVNASKVENGSLTLGDFTEGARKRLEKQGPEGPQGPQGPAGPAGTAEYVGANWSLVDRNVIGDASATLRSGPVSANFGVSVTPPSGVGSLGIHTSSGSDKVAFGNQVDFVDQPVASLETVKYSVFTTGENRALAVNNLPSVSFEVNPHLAGKTCSTLVFVPQDAPANQWS